ncbi:hypothetical protein MAE02_45970 [Microvirga aerophila]|uniref:Uncharacterized protein n=1 Tax=Microvirga aerophila TaxID=670291 RepID=A0A512BY66_9HYPH|nr:hypothetical protein MAE02_45970 [Microvirga aerophila]
MLTRPDLTRDEPNKASEQGGLYHPVANTLNAESLAQGAALLNHTRLYNSEPRICVSIVPVGVFYLVDKGVLKGIVRPVGRDLKLYGLGQQAIWTRTPFLLINVPTQKNRPRVPSPFKPRICDKGCVQQ